MKRIIFIFNLFVLLSAAGSCTREIVLDPGDETVVVVECLLAEEPVQTLRLGLSKGPSQDVAPVVSEAEAVLIDVEAGEEIGIFERQEDGTWTLDYAAEHGHLYRLEVLVPGYDLVWAEQRMPRRSDSYAEIELRDKGFTTYTKFYAGTAIVLDPNCETTWISAWNYNPETGKREQAEYLCTDAPYVDKFNVCGVYDPPSREFTFSDRESIFDQDYGYYSKDLYLYSWLKDYPLHRKYLRLDISSVSRDELERYPICIAGSLTGTYYCYPNNSDYYYDGYYWYHSSKPLNPPPYKDENGLVVVTQFSDDYDKYLCGAIMLQMYDESSDLSSVFIRENLHSNINGGLGIFGAKTDTILRMALFYGSFEFEYAEGWDRYVCVGETYLIPPLYDGVNYSEAL